MNFKNSSFMKITKTIIVGLTTEFVLTFLSILMMQIGGGVGIAGGSVNKPIICVKG